jgi:hypothetical protein
MNGWKCECWDKKFLRQLKWQLSATKVLMQNKVFIFEKENDSKILIWNLFKFNRLKKIISETGCQQSTTQWVIQYLLKAF